MSASFRVALALAAALGLARADAASRPLYEDPHASLEDRVEDLLARLTPAEKVSLLSGGSLYGTQPIERLGIPALHFSDGPNGVRSNEGLAATAFPTGSALAATWNPEVLEEVGEAIGREALALDVQVMLGPDVNIQRSPLAGRNFEDYSEDPYLAGTLGIAFVRGVQSQGVGTSVKHFVANEQELERSRSSSNVDERTLREIYLRPFGMIVKEAHPWTVMVSYNRVNGIYMSENRRLVHDVLQGEWGFDGLVMSDWGAVHSTVAAAQSGLDLEMPGPARYFGDRLDQAVRNWQVDESLIDEAARRMLRLVIRSGVLDGKPRPPGELRSARNRAAALHAASEAIVLLKNDRGLLPLDRSRIRSLAVVGPDADVPLYGGAGSSHVISSSSETPLASLRQLAGRNLRILYAASERAVQAARDADAAIVFVGSSSSSETEGRDRPDMQLPGRQNELVEAVLAANPNTIVVLESGAPYALPWAKRVPAILEGWLDGEEGPQALARVLFGLVNPSGKLPFTFPQRLQDNPAYLYYSGGRDANYGEGVFVGYRYYDKRGIEPLFPFGHGLSYTTFEYRNLRVPATVAVGKPVPVSVEVSNAGHRAGAETVELYVGDEATTEVVRPVKELEGFRKVTLAPGETQTVTFTLAPRALSYYDIHHHDWASTPGAHRIFIGSSSRDIRLARDFEWTAAEAPPHSRGGP